MGPARQRRAMWAALILAVTACAGWAPAEAGQRLRVITSNQDLTAIAEEVGGDLVEAESLTRGYQDPHSVEVRPSYMLKLSRADLFLRIGLDHEPWAQQVLEGARNPRILPGARGHVETWRGVELLEVPPAKADRSGGDIHVFGNTHIWLDPENAKVIAQHVAEGLKGVAPGDAPRFEENRRRFVERLDAALPGWVRRLAPFRGTKVVTHHSDFPYFARRFGLTVVAQLEPRPGVPPSPAYVAELTQRIRGEKIPLLIVANFFDKRLPQRIAEESGARLIIVPISVGGLKGIDTYIALMDHLVNAVAGALAGARPPGS